MKNLVLIIALTVFSLSAQAETIVKGSDLFGGIIKNRKTGDRIAIECLPSNTQCDSVNVKLLQKKGRDQYVVMKTLRSKITLGYLDNIAKNLAERIADAREYDIDFVPENWNHSYFYALTALFYSELGYWDAEVAAGAVAIVGTPIVGGVDTVLTAGINTFLLARYILRNAAFIGFEAPRTALMIKRTGKSIRHLIRGNPGNTIRLNNLKFELVREALEKL